MSSPTPSFPLYFVPFLFYSLSSPFSVFYDQLVPSLDYTFHFTLFCILLRIILYYGIIYLAMNEQAITNFASCTNIRTNNTRRDACLTRRGHSDACGVSLIVTLTRCQALCSVPRTFQMPLASGCVLYALSVAAIVGVIYDYHYLTLSGASNWPANFPNQSYNTSHQSCLVPVWGRGGHKKTSIFRLYPHALRLILYLFSFVSINDDFISFCCSADAAVLYLWMWPCTSYYLFSLITDVLIHGYIYII